MDVKITVWWLLSPHLRLWRSTVKQFFFDRFWKRDISKRVGIATLLRHPASSCEGLQHLVSFFQLDRSRQADAPLFPIVQEILQSQSLVFRTPPDRPTHRCGAALDIILSSPSLSACVTVHSGSNCCPLAPLCCLLLSSNHMLCSCRLITLVISSPSLTTDGESVTSWRFVKERYFSESDNLKTANLSGVPDPQHDDSDAPLLTTIGSQWLVQHETRTWCDNERQRMVSLMRRCAGIRGSVKSFDRLLLCHFNWTRGLGSSDTQTCEECLTRGCVNQLEERRCWFSCDTWSSNKPLEATETCVQNFGISRGERKTSPFWKLCSGLERSLSLELGNRVVFDFVTGEWVRSTTGDRSRSPWRSLHEACCWSKDDLTWQVIVNSNGCNCRAVVFGVKNHANQVCNYQQSWSPEIYSYFVEKESAD